ncbi:hypothetical protein ACOMHN_043827 [Nucella lapillus]
MLIAQAVKFAPRQERTARKPQRDFMYKDARAADNRMSLTCRFPQEQWVAAEQYFKVALCFGNCLGNCLGDKTYLKCITQAPKPPPPTYSVADMRHEMSDD